MIQTQLDSKDLESFRFVIPYKKTRHIPGFRTYLLT